MRSPFGKATPCIIGVADTNSQRFPAGFVRANSTRNVSMGTDPPCGLVAPPAESGASLFFAVKLLFVVIAAGAGLAFTFRPGRPISAIATGLAVLAVCAGVFLIPRGFDPSFFPASEFPAQFPVRAMKSNGAHTTYVVEHPSGDILYFDSHPMSGTGPKARRYMRLMAHFPLLAQPEPRRVLLICFGVGNTAAAITATGVTFGRSARGTGVLPGIVSRPPLPGLASGLR
jgi:hypothetical protein